MNRQLLAACLLIASATWAGDATYRFFFDLAPKSLDEMDAILASLSASLDGNEPPGSPLVVILHGSEANAFVRGNYRQNKARVDLAALLDAHGYIDVRMCATWMRLNGIGEQDIPPFIETVPYGPGEVEKLREAGYLPSDRTSF